MHPGNPNWDQIRNHIHDHMQALFKIDDTRGLELFAMLQGAAHLSRLLDSQLGEDLELSGPRWRLLLRLFVEEYMGNTNGITPTDLSQSQRVSKNTISALLRGLETQGLIQRSLDTADLRAFRIQLAPAGREYLRTAAPRRIESLNHLLSGLSSQEQDQLTALLDKLQRSLMEQYHPAGKDDETLDQGAMKVPFNQE